MTKTLKVTLTNISNPYHRNYNVYKVFIVKKGNPFKARGIEISRDHNILTLIPSECLDGELSYWTYAENNKVECHYPNEKVEVGLDTVESVTFRDPDIDRFEPSLKYHFSATHSIDYLSYFLQRYLGITVLIEPNSKEQK